MIYVIIAAVAALALLLLFWDDHDSSYDRGDGRSRYSRKAKEKRTQSQAQQPKVEFGTGQKSEHKSEAKPETKSTAWGPKENVKNTVINVVESIIKEVKEQNADSLKAMQQDVRKAFDEARTAFNDALKGAGRRATGPGVPRMLMSRSRWRRERGMTTRLKLTCRSWIRWSTMETLKRIRRRSTLPA